MYTKEKKKRNELNFEHLIISDSDLLQAHVNFHLNTVSSFMNTLLVQIDIRYIEFIY